jgi:hypothetical protein
MVAVASAKVEPVWLVKIKNVPLFVWLLEAACDTAPHVPSELIVGAVGVDGGM